MEIPADCLLLIDKVAGPTSHDLVKKLRFVLKDKTIGHTGTLDPFATGLMIIVKGQATKLSEYLVAQDKEYEAEIILGATSSTLDKTGDIKFLSDFQVPSSSQINEAIGSMIGELELKVPDHSAVKVNGKKLYEFAHKNIIAPIVIKKMFFESVQILKIHENRVWVKIKCGKGAYIRAWADEFGIKLGVGGYLESLRRIAVGNFRVENAAFLDFHQTKLETKDECVIPMDKALVSWPKIEIDGNSEQLALNGGIPHAIKSTISDLIRAQASRAAAPGWGIQLWGKGCGKLVSLLRVESNEAKVARVFNTWDK